MPWMTPAPIAIGHRNTSRNRVHDAASTQCSSQASGSLVHGPEKENRKPSATTTAASAAHGAAEFDPQNARVHQFPCPARGPAARNSRVQSGCRRRTPGPGRSQLVRSPVEDELSLLEQDDVGARRGDVLDEMRRDHHTGIAPQFLHEIAEPHALRRIEPGRRLVEQEDVRVVHDRLRDPDPPHHPAGECLHLVVRAIGETDPFDRALHRPRDVLFGHFLEPRDVLDEFPDGEPFCGSRNSAAGSRCGGAGGAGR